jgi:hypothetical protein
LGAAAPVRPRRVFEEFGITNPQPDAHKIDCLITPELRGATTIRDLWPQRKCRVL